MGKNVSKMVKSLYGEREIRIVMVGLDNAGKTTLLHNFNLGEIFTTVPTADFRVETLEYKNVTVTVWDVGNGKMHPSWRYYFQNAHGFIFVVDSSDRNRISEASAQLHYMLDQDELKDATVLVFANKKDRPNAMSIQDITDKLSLKHLTRRRWEIKTTNAIKGEGIKDGLRWLYENVPTSK